MNFFLNGSVAGIEICKRIVRDYFEWFRKGDDVCLSLFFTEPSFIVEMKKYSAEKSRKDSASFILTEEIVAFDRLHEYYGKKILLNEWIPYRDGDIFRLYRILAPLHPHNSYENQPVSIQFDVRYDQTARKETRVYSKTQLAHVFSAIDYFRSHNIVDFGCGCGANYFFLKESLQQGNVRYQGLDTSRFLISKAKDLYEDQRVSFGLMDVCQTPFSDDAFDFGFSESLLPLVSTPLNALNEMARITRFGFFAAMYTLPEATAGLSFDGKLKAFPLSTGATWKYFRGVTENTFYLPRTKDIYQFCENHPKVALLKNNTHQFFRPLGIHTENLFLFPKDWYLASEKTFKKWNFFPLM